MRLLENTVVYHPLLHLQPARAIPHVLTRVRIHVNGHALTRVLKRVRHAGFHARTRARATLPAQVHATLPVMNLHAPLHADLRAL